MITRAMRVLFVAAIVVIGYPFAVSADAPLVVSHPALAASVERLTAESRTFRDALAAVATTGRHTILTTPEKVDIPFDRTVLAQGYPIGDDDSRVETMVIVINLDLLQKLSGLSMTAVDFEDDLDRIVAHEIYGHAVPVLLAGKLAGNCPDPAVGQSALTSCAVQRENVIRREMRLGQRLEYGRDSLALARRQF